MRATSLPLLLVLGVAGLAASQGCGSSDEDVTTAAGGKSAGTAQGGAGGSTGTFSSTGGSGSGGKEGCAEESAEATTVIRPVDIIIVIDNSGSMGEEIVEVEEQINANFATILDSAMPAIDYRVIMVSEFGPSSDREICISAPLGGITDANMDGHCDSVPSQPLNTAKFFHHSMSVGSHDALCKLLAGHDQADQYNLQPNGYKDVLRPDSFKFFLVITDDGVNCSHNSYYSDENNVGSGQSAGDQWDADLLTLNPAMFGADEMNRNYSFWSIISQQPYMVSSMKPYGVPVPPSEPITTAECTPSAVDPGTGYQHLSIKTGGYRFPTCGLDYTDIFQLMAEGVIEGAQTPCVFDIPDPPPGEELDLNQVSIDYSSGGILVQSLAQVSDATQCDAGSFYIENDQIHLCPDVCDVVQADEDSKIDIVFGCSMIAD